MASSSAPNKRVRITDAADELVVERSGTIAVKAGASIALEAGASLTIGGEAVHAGTDPGDVPAGGTAGQVLKKTSNADFDTEWDDESAGGGGAVDSVFGQTGAVSDLSGDVTTNGSSVTTLADSGVTADTYGDASNIPQITVDAKGRVTSVTEVPAAGGGGSTITNIREITAAGHTPQLITDGTIYCNVPGGVPIIDLDNSFPDGTIFAVICNNACLAVGLHAPLGGDIMEQGANVSLSTSGQGVFVQKLANLRWVCIGNNSGFP